MMRTTRRTRHVRARPHFQQLDPLEPRLLLAATTSTALFFNRQPAPQPVSFYSLLTLTALVHTPEGTPATGYIDFARGPGQVSFNRILLHNGFAQMEFTDRAGSYQYEARYLGDDAFAPSTSPPVPVTLLRHTLPVNLSFIDQTSTAPAAVQAILANRWDVQATGTVTLRYDGKVLATYSVLDNDGHDPDSRATFSLHAVPPGNHFFEASYSGDSSYTASAGGAYYTIPPTLLAPVPLSPATVDLTVSAPSLQAGSPLTLTATVPTYAAAGFIQFLDGATPLATVPMTGRVTTFTVSTLPSGTHTLSAKFIPSSAHTPADSNAQFVTVLHPTIIDVLAVYTPATSDLPWGQGTPIQLAQQMIDDANVVLTNSRVAVSVRLAAATRVEYMATGDYEVDMDRLKNAIDGYMDEVHTLRNRVGADLVLFLHPGPHYFPNGGYAWARTMSPAEHPTAPADVSAFTTIWCQVPRSEYVFARQLGYLLGVGGAANDPLPSLAPYGHGYRFTGKDGVAYRDLMADAPGAFLPYYSNPDILYAGKPLGSAAANAARALAEYAPTVATFRIPQVVSAIDTDTDSTVRGWVFDAKSLHQALTVRVVVDGATVPSFAADMERPDIVNTYGTTSHGFSYTLPSLPQGDHVVQLFAQDTAGADVLLATREISNPPLFFDPAYYLATYPDVAAAVAAGGPTAWDHFRKAGQYEQRNPSMYFDPAYYLARNPDVAAALWNHAVPSAFRHYLSSGQYEMRQASPYFDERTYRRLYPDVDAAVVTGGLRSGLQHFLAAGQFEGRTPTAFFNPAAYRASLAHALPTPPASPYAYFLTTGNPAGHDPAPWFSTSVYLANNPDVAAAVANRQVLSAFDHFVRGGWREGRHFSVMFSESAYLAHNADVAAAVSRGGFASGFEHFLLAGQYEDRLM